MDKAAVTLLLRDSGVPLSEAHDATNSILRGDTAAVRLPTGADMQRVRHQLDELGVVL
jgi:hypothetical protein